MPKLIWTGKDKVINHHHEVPFRVLDKKYNFTASAENSNNNRIIHGDNLEALKSLLPEFEGKVKCIYIDPPYNTGNEGWVYNDNVNDEKIKRWLGQVVGKEGEDLSRHDKWLCMMYPRLKLLKKLLSDDGFIFISIDENENGYLRVLLDEIFGSSNFVASFVWQKRQSPDSDEKFATNVHDDILCYAKRKTENRLNRLPRTEEADARYNNPDNDSRGVWTSSDLTRREYREHDFYPIVLPSGRSVTPAAGRSWSVPKESFEKLVLDNRIWFGANGDAMPRRKRFLTEVSEGIVPTTWWTSDLFGDNQSAKREIRTIFFDQDDIFQTPKPTKLIQRILELATNKNSIVLDSFAGSGTTAHSVLKLNLEDGGNRQFILIETMDYAETITAERVRRVMQGYGEETKTVEGLGGAFDYYEIGDVIFDGEGNLNETIGVEEIRKYVAFTEKIPLEDQVTVDNDKSPYLLGMIDGSAYFFVYEPNEITNLNLEFLASLNFKPQALVVYADNCLLSKDMLQKYNIIFKKIPRDITRF